MKTFKRTLLFVLSLPFLLLSIIVTVVWAPIFVVGMPLILFTEWLQDEPRTEVNWLLFILPVCLYLEVIWQKDLI